MKPSKKATEKKEEEEKKSSKNKVNQKETLVKHTHTQNCTWCNRNAIEVSIRKRGRQAPFKVSSAQSQNKLKLFSNYHHRRSGGGNVSGGGGKLLLASICR